MLCSFERQIWLNDCQLEIVPLEGNKNDDDNIDEDVYFFWMSGISGYILTSIILDLYKKLVCLTNPVQSLNYTKSTCPGETLTGWVSFHGKPQ